MAIKQVSKHLIGSVGIILELGSCYNAMFHDNLYDVVVDVFSECKLDMRSQFNYAILLFTAGKVSYRLIL